MLKEIARIYREEHDKVRQNADTLKDRLAPKFEPGAGRDPGDAALDDLARRLLRARRSDTWRHQRRAEISAAAIPEFPVARRPPLRPCPICIEAVTHTLTHIAQGGIYDHLGGGFARYSVDERWLVPHFEKMLYDNALLLELMTEAWRETTVAALRAAHRARPSTGCCARWSEPRARFASSLDADSEGEEGKFYVWSLAEIEDILGADNAKLFAEIYDVTAEGNFEGAHYSEQTQ